ADRHLRETGGLSPVSRTGRRRVAGLPRAASRPRPPPLVVPRAGRAGRAASTPSPVRNDPRLRECLVRADGRPPAATFRDGGTSRSGSGGPTAHKAEALAQAGAGDAPVGMIDRCPCKDGRDGG